MSTWHQERNQHGLSKLWEQHPTLWKCISDTHGKFASCMTFATEEEAQNYVSKTGDILIPPKGVS